jgi:phosphoglycolate phosphatase
VDDVIMIGDRHFDIDGAVANGVRGIGVLWGFGDREELDKAGAWKVVETPAEIATLVGATVPG